MAVSSRGTAAEPALNIEMPPVLMKMIRNEGVWDELELTDEQQRQLESALRPLDARWWPSRIEPMAVRRTVAAQVTQDLKQKLRTLLSDVQWQRLLQLERQALGTRMVFMPDVAQALQLTDTQLKQFPVIASETDALVQKVEQRTLANEDQQTLREELLAAQAKERTETVGSLTESQQQMIGKLVGETFDFSRVKRTHAGAPSLEMANSRWLQPLPQGSLEALRGNVVAVHFYAFQCINCKRNLPHYTAWHQDYADQGLVVLGIQTPETSAERDPQQVAAAVKAAGIKYPVLMDGASENWKAWGNTMWPTVYLIDKQGYVRTWWQGELNWQGNAGEAQFRKHIETLLAE